MPKAKPKPKAKPAKKPVVAKADDRVGCSVVINVNGVGFSRGTKGTVTAVRDEKILVIELLDGSKVALPCIDVTVGRKPH